jgi:hypothetical protein
MKNDLPTQRPLSLIFSFNYKQFCSPVKFRFYGIEMNINHLKSRFSPIQSIQCVIPMSNNPEKGNTVSTTSWQKEVILINDNPSIYKLLNSKTCL